MERRNSRLEQSKPRESRATARAWQWSIQIHSVRHSGKRARHDTGPRSNGHTTSTSRRLKPEDTVAEALADVLESLNDAERFLTWDQKSLPALRAAVKQDPNNSERRASYANLLWRLGREEEAARQYESSLEPPRPSASIVCAIVATISDGRSTEGKDMPRPSRGLSGRSDPQANRSNSHFPLKT
jgi:tetratricopeptide (TPR) repeat protein